MAWPCPWGRGDGVLAKFLVGVCCWDSETLTHTLYQSTFASILQPYSRLDAKNPYPILDYLPETFHPI